MIKIFLLALILSSQLLWAKTEQAAIGTELGVARLSTRGQSMIGTSWMFHAEYQIDRFLGLYGQGGQSLARESGDSIKQNTFTGGFKFNLLPAVEVRVGVAKEVIESDIDGSKGTKRELGPMTALAAYIPIGAIKLGTSATFIRTGNSTTTALRGLLLVMF